MYPLPIALIGIWINFTLTTVILRFCYFTFFAAPTVEPDWRRIFLSSAVYGVVYTVAVTCLPSWFTLAGNY